MSGKSGITRRRVGTLALAAGMMLCVGRTVNAVPLAARDGRGKVITLKRAPQRIVSIAPSNTEILFALGLGAKIVGVTDYCDWPAAAKSRPKVGGVVLNIERIIALRPDLVVAKWDFQKANVARLEALHIPVFAVDPHNVRDTLTTIEAVGAITGAMPQARRVTARMRRELAEVAKVADHDKRRPRVLSVISSRPLIVVGPNTFLDNALKVAGAINGAADARGPYPQFSLESAVARRPDVILLSAGKPGEIMANPVWRSTPAVAKRRVYAPAFMPVLERPGPRLTGAVLQLARLLHP